MYALLKVALAFCAIFAVEPARAEMIRVSLIVHLSEGNSGDLAFSLIGGDGRIFFTAKSLDPNLYGGPTKAMRGFFLPATYQGGR